MIDCLKCGEAVSSVNIDILENCEFCNKEFKPNRTCKNKHYICDDCYNKKLKDTITNYVQNTDSKNPQEIMLNIMKNKLLYMHGPIHHYLMPAVLLAAYKNSGGDINLEKSLKIAEDRSNNVPGGICGFWGACGASIGAGIFTSIITGSSPLAHEQWSLPNEMTSKTLAKISSCKGPRCCKRNAFLTIPKVIDLIDVNFHIKMEKSEDFKCFFFNWNNECLESDCPFHPASNI